MEPVRVLVVIRESITRTGIVALLADAEDVSVIGAPAALPDGRRQAEEEMPQVALVGTTWAEGPGVETAVLLRRSNPSVSVVLVATAPQDADEGLFAAMRQGLAGYAAWGVEGAVVVDLVRRAGRGGYPIDEQVLSQPGAAGRVMEAFRQTDALLAERPGLVGAFTSLTDRELQVLSGVRDGLTNAEISSRLGTSPQTVKNQVSGILKKLEVNDRTAAVMEAIRRGWLTTESSQ